MAAVAVAAAPASAHVRAAARPATLSVDLRQQGAFVPRDFLGLSFEAGSLPQIAQYGDRGNLVGFLRSLGPGVLRFGGVTVDSRTAWSPDGQSGPAWAATLVSPADLANLAGLSSAAGWRVLLGLNLAHYDPQSAAGEAQAAQSALGPALAGVELGNEPNAFALHGWRSEPWDFDRYQGEVAQYRQAIDAAASGIPLAGPDVSSPIPLDWMSAEALDETPALLTAHYYSGSCEDRPQPTVANLLAVAARAAERRTLNRLAAISDASGTPLRMDETNNVACGGLPGVSNTFGAALWAVDYIVRAMRAGLAGINFHGLPSSCLGYAPLCAPTDHDLRDGTLTAQPEWYALLLASRLSGTRVVAAGIRPAPRDVSVGAFLTPAGSVRVAIVDESPPGARPLTLSLRVPRRFAHGSVLRLTGRSPTATYGVALGGASVGPDGSWAGRVERLRERRGRLSVSVAPSSAALLTLEPR